MGFLSNLFGGNKEEKALKEAMEMVRRLVDDEQYQLSIIHPEMKKIIDQCPAYDRDPNGRGAFGFCETNPIPVNGPVGEMAYLSRLETNSGERILFHRIGAINKVDVYEAVTFSGSEWFIFYLDFYHPKRSRALPDGFRITKAAPQFSGFHNYCPKFPYDFIEMKHNDPFSIGFIPILGIAEKIEARVYRRPIDHASELDLVLSQLTSKTSQSK